MNAPATMRKGEKTRQIFLQAGRHVFVRDGYLNAEISEIAKAAGKSNGTFYIYFENKARLLHALIDEFNEDVAQRFQRHPPEWYGASAQADWARIIASMWAAFKAHAEMFYALAQASLIDKEFAAANDEIRERARLDFAQFLAARQKAGFCRSLNIHYTAAALETMIVRCQHDWMANGGLHDPREEERAQATLSAIFTAVMLAP